VRRLVVAALGLGALSLLGACRAPSAPSVAARVAVAPAAGVAGARALVPACARAGVALEAPVARADLDGGAAEVASLLEEAAARGVPIALRPIAADGVGGPAISSGALPELSSDVERLVAIIAAAPPPRATLVVELAPPRALAVEVIARLDASSGAGRGGRLYELLGMRLDERGHVADAATLGAIVAGARAGGVAVEARLWPILVDDGRDGDSALGDALDVPVLARAGTAAALPAIADAVDVVRLVATRSLWLRAVAPADARRSPERWRRSLARSRRRGRGWASRSARPASTGSGCPGARPPPSSPPMSPLRAPPGSTTWCSTSSPPSTPPTRGWRRSPPLRPRARRPRPRRSTTSAPPCVTPTVCSVGDRQKIRPPGAMPALRTRAIRAPRPRS
jgi:hypothetical protein